MQKDASIKDCILLIDGMYFIHRSNIKFGDKSKQSFVIVYNFFRSLRALIEQFNPRKIFFCLEGKNCFRYSLYPDYKKNRIKTGSVAKLINEDFNIQRDIILDLIGKLPILTIKSDGYESDDVIATLSENLKDENVIIISNDSDFIQLLQKGYGSLKIFNPSKKEYATAPEYHYLMWKSLRGDKNADNIPGIVGDKTAIKIITNEIKLKKFFSSEENVANFNLNKELIELKIIDDDKLIISDYKIDFDFIKEEFKKMELFSMIEDKYWNRFIETFSSIV